MVGTNEKCGEDSQYGMSALLRHQKTPGHNMWVTGYRVGTDIQGPPEAARLIPILCVGPCGWVACGATPDAERVHLGIPIIDPPPTTTRLA